MNRAGALRRRWIPIALAVALVVGIALVAFGGADGDGDSARPSSTSTTVSDLPIEAPSDWQRIPLPQLGFGLAVPPGWQATVTDPDALDLLEQRNIEDPGFVDAARNAAFVGAVLYAAGADDDGGVNDLKVQRLPRPRGTSSTQLRVLATALLREQGATAEVVMSEIDGDAVATFTFDVEQAGIEFVATQVLRAGDDEVVSLIITSEDPSQHDELVQAIAATLLLTG